MYIMDIFYKEKEYEKEIWDFVVLEEDNVINWINLFFWKVYKCE